MKAQYFHSEVKKNSILAPAIHKLRAVSAAGFVWLKRGLAVEPNSAFLSPHLRRDAGMDELDAERRRVEQAPLIKCDSGRV